MYISTAVMFSKENIIFVVILEQVVKNDKMQGSLLADYLLNFGLYMEVSSFSFERFKSCMN